MKNVVLYKKKSVGTVKHSKPGKHNPPLIIHKFQEDPSICPVHTITEYIQQTQPWRDETKTKVFLANTLDHQPVTTATISNWIKQALEQAGIDIERFKPHSTRAAGSSKTSNKGMNKHTILTMGNWKRGTTWEKFYHRPTSLYTQTQQFQHTVLKN